jgi:hypothetical protein
LTPDSSEALLQTAADIEKWSAKILKDAPLSKQQRTDIEVVLQATQQFQTFLSAELEIVDNFPDTEVAELQRVRHQLLNHLNIIVGFTRMLVRDLPDNLLMHMALIRKINETGQGLIERVTALR